nr:Maff2 family protein [Ruminococcus sp. 1001270H_150608_F2]
MSASALNTNVGAINYSNFISKTETVLKTLLILIGAGLALWGVVNLIEGYGNDNPGAKSQGIKQTMGGIGIILIGVILVPVLGNLMTSAMSN